MIEISNKNYYPTPARLIKRMWDKVKNPGEIDKILEPSAGQGHIIDWITNKTNGGYGSRYDISAIEIDPENISVLRSKKCTIIDSDFLSYSGTDRFDLILMNPPFDLGLDHLNKAIDIMYSGQIVCLLNAETIKNPFSLDRKALVQRLTDLNAEIEFIENAFKDAERKTGVEVALVYIKIDRDISTDLFQDCDDKTKSTELHIEQDKDLVSGSSVESKVELYNHTLQIGLETIYNYYRNYNRIAPWIKLNCNPDEKYHYLRNETLNGLVNNAVNQYVQRLRKSYWKSILDLKEVQSRMTEKKQTEFHAALDTQSNMDFTGSNIRQFILNVVGSYEQTLTEAVAEIFDKLTTKHSWFSESSKNIYLYNGWKTNNAYRCNKKVILPIYGGYSHPFISYYGEWKADRYQLRELDDIDKICNYFDGLSEYTSIIDALETNLATGKTTGIESTYFLISVYKKRTIHLTFRSEDILRRFNITACKHKRWLPEDYGKKAYTDMTSEEQAVVQSFEGVETYNKQLNQIGFVAKPDVKLLGE